MYIITHMYIISGTLCYIYPVGRNIVLQKPDGCGASPVLLRCPKNSTNYITN